MRLCICDEIPEEVFNQVRQAAIMARCKYLCRMNDGLIKLQGKFGVHGTASTRTIILIVVRIVKTITGWDIRNTLLHLAANNQTVVETHYQVCFFSNDRIRFFGLDKFLVVGKKYQVKMTASSSSKLWSS